MTVLRIVIIDSMGGTGCARAVPICGQTMARLWGVSGVLVGFSCAAVAAERKTCVPCLILFIVDAWNLNDLCVLTRMQTTKHDVFNLQD